MTNLSCNTEKRFDDLAEAECLAVNALGRDEARETGHWDEQGWFKVDEWKALRGAMMLVVGVIRLNGTTDGWDSTVLDNWGIRWLEEPIWANLYTDSKARALCILCDRLKPSVVELYAAAECCAARLSPAQQLALADQLADLSSQCSVEHRALVDDVRETMLLT